MAESEKKRPLVLKQKPMLLVVYALVPLVLLSVYFFGLRSLVILVVVNISGFIAEYVMASKAKQQVSSAVFVTGFIYALSLPPTIPLWIAAVGIVFGIVFGKMVFGGFGRNVFNPALSGRAFVYVSFGVPMTSRWGLPLWNPGQGLAGGFTSWQADAITKATPLVKLSAGGEVDWQSLFLGNVSGALGETSALLILICGIFLLFRKVSSFRIVLGGFAGYLFFQSLFWLLKLGSFYDPFRAVISGSFLFGLFFCITDPISASQTTNPGRWIYGLFFGILCALIRTFSSWPEAVTFAVLLANMFAPLIDYLIKGALTAMKERGRA